MKQFLRKSSQFRYLFDKAYIAIVGLTGLTSSVQRTIVPMVMLKSDVLGTFRVCEE